MHRLHDSAANVPMSATLAAVGTALFTWNGSTTAAVAAGTAITFSAVAIHSSFAATRYASAACATPIRSFAYDAAADHATTRTTAFRAIAASAATIGPNANRPSTK